MNSRSLYGRAQRVIASVLVIMGTVAALAADLPTANQPTPSKDMREKMAILHEQMATCLRSDKPLVDCRSEMMKNCQDTLQRHGCHMMRQGMLGGGAGRSD